MDWLNPLNAIQVQNAIKLHRKIVILTLNDNKRVKFDIEYRDEKCFIKPATGQIYNALVPCGWFTIDKILNPIFLERA